MRIDIFKDPSLFESLIPFNQQVIDAWDRAVVLSPEETWIYRAAPREEVCYWFNPREVRKLPFSRHYPELVPLNFDPKWCLLDYYPNYVSLFVINLLYNARKDVMVEDVCCGPGKLVFYLSCLGFKNFSVVDDFSQMRPVLLEELLQANNVRYRLNKPIVETQPVVVTQVGYPFVVRPLSGSVELVCAYLHSQFRVDLPKALQDVGDYRLLCHDTDDLMAIYARADMADVFSHQLASYAV